MSPASVTTPLGEEIVKNPLIGQGLWLGALRLARGNEAAAGDLYQEMVAEALEAEANGKWSPEGPETAHALCSRLLRTIGGRERRRDTRHLKRHVDGASVDPPSRAPGPDAAVAEADLRHKLEKTVREDLERRGEKGRLPLEMLDSSAKGLEGHEALANDIGCSLKEIADAQRRLTAAAKRAMEQLGVAR